MYSTRTFTKKAYRTITEKAYRTTILAYSQARSQEFAMGGLFWGFALENFAFFCKNN